MQAWAAISSHSPSERVLNCWWRLYLICISAGYVVCRYWLQKPKEQRFNIFLTQLWKNTTPIPAPFSTWPQRGQCEANQIKRDTPRWWWETRRQCQQQAKGRGQRTDGGLQEGFGTKKYSAVHRTISSSSIPLCATFVSDKNGWGDGLYSNNSFIGMAWSAVMRVPAGEFWPDLYSLIPYL